MEREGKRKPRGADVSVRLSNLCAQLGYSICFVPHNLPVVTEVFVSPSSYLYINS